MTETTQTTQAAGANISEQLSGLVPKAEAVRKQIFFAVFVFDVLALLIAYQIAVPLTGFLIETFHTSSIDRFQATTGLRQIVYFTLCMGILFFLFAGGHYTKRIPWWSQIQQIVRILAFAVLVDGFSSFALELYYSRLLILVNWSLAFGFLLLGRIAGNMIKSRSRSWKLPSVIIGDARSATDALYAFGADSSMGIDVKTILLRDRNPQDYDREEFPKHCRDIEVLDGLAHYEEYIKEHPDNFYIVSLETFRGAKRDHLINLLSRSGIAYAVIPAISRISLYHTEPLYFFGNHVLLLRAQNSVTAPIPRLLKRSMDLLGAGVAAVLFLFPMLAVALMLKAEGKSGKSPFYIAKRVGEGGKIFYCWKFQTMEPGCDHLLHDYLAKNPEAKAYWDRYFKLPDDPRVTGRTARFIRKASIDELPQLWNVLKGEMSLVGPRPILESEIKAYGEHIHEYTSVKPGITGLWQSSGRNETSFQRRVLWDTWYVRNWSLWGDIVIILKTIQVVLNRSGAS